jgi:hypothetical protein
MVVPSLAIGIDDPKEAIDPYPVLQANIDEIGSTPNLSPIREGMNSP